MEHDSRRKFLTRVGTAMGLLTIGNSMKSPGKFSGLIPDGDDTPRPDPHSQRTGDIDFRYAPDNWQSTYCFPDDPHKSLVGKYGELLYGHPGLGADFSKFPHVVTVGLQSRPAPDFIEQTLEAPSIPIITTRLGWNDIRLTLTSFASNRNNDGRVDNLIVEFSAAGTEAVRCTPEIVLTSESKYIPANDGDTGVVRMDMTGQPVFMVLNARITPEESAGIHRFTLTEREIRPEKPFRFFIRFPQANQSLDDIKGRLDDSGDLLKETRLFWQSWKLTGGKVSWSVPEPMGDFLAASVRNIMESREEKGGKKIFQVGPTVYRGQWVIDGCSLLEAARYLGYDTEAQQGLEAIWDLENPEGLIIAGAGEKHWKDTAAAVYLLIRQAELSQDWKYFNEMYPDAHKALMKLRDLITSAHDDGTLSSEYGILPKGFGDSGIGGIRSEYTNTLWTMIALRAILDVADRFMLQRREMIREFYGSLRGAFYQSIKKEMRTHPKGFSYLPMLLSDDPGWKETDIRKQPRPQVAQIYLSQAIYPGLLFLPDDAVVKGHFALMRETMREDVPFESGWLNDNAVWPYNGAITAQAFLWAGVPDMARKMFIGFLNHASPLYAWREEQSLHDAKVKQYIGDMPHNWASAECIRYLRHMMIMEDTLNLRLFQGFGIPELTARKPILLNGTPTRWGRVTLTMEPIENNRWRTVFKREDFDSSTCPKIGMIEMPDVLGGKYYLEKMNGAKVLRSGRRILLSGDSTSWDCTWIIPK